MSTGAIIAIVAIVLIALVAWMLINRMSGAKRRERAIAERRDQAATQEKTAAQERMSRAERAEQEARIVAQKAQQERAAAEEHAARAELHEKGHLDDQHATAIDQDGDGVRDDRESLGSERDAQLADTNGRFHRDSETTEPEHRRS